MAFVNNFSTSFRWCDRLFGTDDKYRQYRERMRAMKKANMSKEEFAAMERKMLVEIEAEGVKAEAQTESYKYGKAKTA